MHLGWRLVCETPSFCVHYPKENTFNHTSFWARVNTWHGKAAKLSLSSILVIDSIEILMEVSPSMCCTGDFARQPLLTYLFEKTYSSLSKNMLPSP